MTKSNHEEKILQLTGARREYLYTHTKSHWKTPLTPTQFPESYQAQFKHSPLGVGVLKFSFHTEIFVNTEETLSDAQFKLISTVITWVPSRSFHSHSLVCLPRFPAGSHLFQLKNKKQKKKKANLYQSFWSDWQNRTLDRKSVSEILKRGPLFSNSETDKEKVHTLVCVDVHKSSNSGHY